MPCHRTFALNEDTVSYLSAVSRRVWTCVREHVRKVSLDALTAPRSDEMLYCRISRGQRRRGE